MTIKAVRGISAEQMGNCPDNGRTYWTRAEIKAAIERCETDVEKMIQRHATPDEIGKRRKGIDMLWKWIELTDD